MEGVSGVFSVQNWWETGASREIQQGRNVADAAKDARVPHFVYSSVGGADRNTDITHWKTKWAVEKLQLDVARIDERAEQICSGRSHLPLRRISGGLRNPGIESLRVTGVPLLA